MTTLEGHDDDKAANPVVFFDIALGGKTDNSIIITTVFQYSDPLSPPVPYRDPPHNAPSPV